MKFLSCIASASLLVLSACSGGSSSAPTAQRIYATEALSGAPVVTSRTTMKKYADLFGSACLEEASSYSASMAKFESAGMKMIQGPVGGNERRGGAFSDGTAYGHLFVRKDGYTICEVALKTNDDDPLVAELETVMSKSQFSEAPFSRGGLFGAGYTIKKGNTLDKGIFVARQQRSAQSPTSFRIIDFKR